MNRAKWLGVVWVSFIAVILLGCGGGGGGGGTSSTSTTSTSGDAFTIKIEAQVSSGALMDPRNIQVGQTVQFVLVKFDITTGSSSLVPSGAYSASFLLGNLSSSGSFTATTASGNTYSISTNFNGTTYTSPYSVTPVQPLVIGQVVDTNGVVVPFATAQFFDSSRNMVGQSTADGNGNFIASVPTTGTRFNLAQSSLSTAYYFAIFNYGPGTYDVLATNCSAPLPTLTGTATFSLPYIVQVDATRDLSGVANTPPAPPSCSP